MAIQEGVDVVDVDDEDDVSIEDSNDSQLDDDSPEEFTVLVEGRDEIPPDDEVTRSDGPNLDELLNRVTELQTQIGSSQKTESALNEGFSRLAESLRDRQDSSKGPQQATSGTPPESYDALKKRLSKNFYDDPVGAMEEMLKYVASTEIVPALNETRNMISSTATITSKQVALNNETNKTIYDRYGEEVERLVKTLPPTPDVYEKAFQQVGVQHMNEILEERIQAAVAEATQGLTKPKPKTPSTGVTPQGGGSRAPVKKAARRVLPAHLRDLADAKGMTYEDMYRAYYGEK